MFSGSTGGFKRRFGKRAEVWTHHVRAFEPMLGSDDEHIQRLIKM